MSVERVKEYLKQFDLDHRVIELQASSATVTEAALALKTEARRIAKTLAFRHQSQAHVIVTAGDMKIDNAKYKAVFLEKARFLSPSETQTMIGFDVGGVCPFALPEGIEVYLDVSLKRFVTVYPACGNDHSAIELSIDELCNSTQSQNWVDVCKSIL